MPNRFLQFRKLLEMLTAQRLQKKINVTFKDLSLDGLLITFTLFSFQKPSGKLAVLSANLSAEALIFSPLLLQSPSHPF